jgi:glycerol-3-phosphate dehydrogenase (NAD(P)+)
MKVALYGIGNFGYALLKHLDRFKSSDHEIVAFDRNDKLLASLRKTRTHLFFHKKFKISSNISFASSPKELVNDADIVILAVTSSATREVMKNIGPHLKQNVILLNTAKALDFKTGQPLSEVVNGSLKTKHSYSVMAGGTIARDLFKHDPLGIDIASDSKDALKTLKDLFSSETLKVYTTQDLTGVEYASAFKNVIALLAGTVNGLGLSYGSETHLISRASAEIGGLIVKHFGGQAKTFSMGSQCWGNDLWMSCTGQTRNRKFGVLLGKGFTNKQALAMMEKEHNTVEGLNTLASMKKALGSHFDQYPVLVAIHDIVAKDKNPSAVISQLMHV